MDDILRSFVWGNVSPGVIPVEEACPIAVRDDLAGASKLNKPMEKAKEKDEFEAPSAVVSWQAVKQARTQLCALPDNVARVSDHLCEAIAFLHALRDFPEDALPQDRILDLEKAKEDLETQLFASKKEVDALQKELEKEKKAKQMAEAAWESERKKLAEDLESEHKKLAEDLESERKKLAEDLESERKKLAADLESAIAAAREEGKKAYKHSQEYEKLAFDCINEGKKFTEMILKHCYHGLETRFLSDLRGLLRWSRYKALPRVRAPPYKRYDLSSILSLTIPPLKDPQAASSSSTANLSEKDEASASASSSSSSSRREAAPISKKRLQRLPLALLDQRARKISTPEKIETSSAGTSISLSTDSSY